MKVFDELGQTVREQWARFDFDNRAFPDIVSRVLSAFHTCCRWRSSISRLWKNGFNGAVEFTPARRRRTIGRISGFSGST